MRPGMLNPLTVSYSSIDSPLLVLLLLRRYLVTR